jgi:hypothetical protein
MFIHEFADLIFRGQCKSKQIQKLFCSTFLPFKRLEFMTRKPSCLPLKIQVVLLVDSIGSIVMMPKSLLLGNTLKRRVILIIIPKFKSQDRKQRKEYGKTMTWTGMSMNLLSEKAKDKPDTSGYRAPSQNSRIDHTAYICNCCLDATW